MSFTIDSTTWNTPNFSRENGIAVTHPPQGILLHSCEGTAASSLPWLTNPRSGVSCTYYVTRTGIIFQLAPDTYRTWHAGTASYAGLTDWNTAIGIELEHREGQDYPAIQMQALEWLCRRLIGRWTIPRNRVAAHRWVAVPRGRKGDPSNWSDADMRAWIAGLYPAADPWAAWGAAFPLPAEQRTFGIPQAWLANAWLGAATSDEQRIDGGVLRSFANGWILYSLRSNTAQAIRRF